MKDGMNKAYTNNVNPDSSRISPLTQPSPSWGEDIKSPFIVHSLACPTIRNRNGFTYIALLAAIVIIGITLGSAAKSWQNIAQREKEEELLFRGNQYRQAIERYYNALPGRHQFPNSIDVLLKDERTPIDIVLVGGRCRHPAWRGTNDPRRGLFLYSDALRYFPRAKSVN
jgi:Tfp pilus assembly protein PilE